MAPHSSTLAWNIPWTEEPGGLQSMGSLRVGHDWATSLSRIGEGNGNPLQCSCLDYPRDGAAVYGAAQSWTRLTRLSSSSSSLLTREVVMPLIKWRHGSGGMGLSIVGLEQRREKRSWVCFWSCCVQMPEGPSGQGQIQLLSGLKLL